MAGNDVVGHIYFSGNKYILDGDFKESAAKNVDLRDWFAGQSIMGYARDTGNFDALARAAYEIADAMLKAREK